MHSFDRSFISLSIFTTYCPTERKGIRKGGIRRAKFLGPNADTFLVNGSHNRNDSGKENDEGKKHDTHDRKEENEIDAKHPVEIHGQLLIGVADSSNAPRSARGPLPTMNETLKEGRVALLFGGLETILYLLLTIIIQIRNNHVILITSSLWFQGRFVGSPASAHAIAPGHGAAIGLIADLGKSESRRMSEKGDPKTNQKSTPLLLFTYKHSLRPSAIGF